MVPEQVIQVVDSDMMTVMNTIANSDSQDDGFYVCDISDIIWKYKNWKNIMPRVKTFYAVKCNDSRMVLETLAALGSGFDCASKEEIKKVLSLGVNPDRIIFANPTKKNSHIRYAAENGVTMMTFDCENELYKIKQCHSTAELVIRIKFDDVTARYVLGEKFGVYPDAEAYHLLKLARSLDINVIGVCFHIGSDFKDFTVLTNAIGVARKVFDMGFQLGYNFKLLDIGGGFSGTSGTSIEKLGCLINDTLEKHFPDHRVKIISEPGRYYVTSAFNLVSRIHTKKIVRKTISDNKTEYIRMYYVDVSVYNSLIPCLFEEFFKIFPLRNVDYKMNHIKYPSIVWGPTCDPYDKISNNIEQLPEMEVGDWLVIEDAGAYTLSIACEFNGFCLPKIHGFIKKEDWILLTEEVACPLPKDRFVQGKEKDIFLTDEFKEWRLLGQERDGCLLFSWIHSKKNNTPSTHIGIYNHEDNTLTPIYSFAEKTDCIQASINSDRTILAYVVKENSKEQSEYTYNVYLYKIHDPFDKINDMKLYRNRQILVQFLYPKQSILSENKPVKFLILIHQESILQYQIKSKDADLNNDFIFESLVRKFIWAQWDPVQQTLYYIHNRKRNKFLVEGEEEENIIHSDAKVTPTLSGLQFNDEVPHETVLNIPLNLPHFSEMSGTCLIYEDDTVPLRVHDCSLDLIVLTDSSGFVCICHHYLYQPIQPVVDFSDEDTSPIHFAYSVTVLHQSCVIHCVVPEIPWNKARKIRPLFKINGDHLVIFIPDICTHLLDIGLMHEPCCHVTTKPLITNVDTSLLCLTPIVPLDNGSVVNLATLDLIDINIPTTFLVETYKSDTLLENKLSILHYLILHAEDMDTASELILWQSERPFVLGFPQILKEFLIATSYASVQRNLPCDANKLINLLPVTSQRIGHEFEVELDQIMICLSQDVLWNASMMLLSPQQRIVPYRSDIWVKLWDQLAKLTKGVQRFKPSQVVDKLMVSLVCYQPEILSRCSTPLSPNGGSSSTFNDFLNNQCGKRNQMDSLPFFEVDNCTASKQEHIISVNLRELSMHLLKQSTDNKMNRFQWQSQTPMHVHAVATRYITAQLEQSRQLCQLLCKAATYEPRFEPDKGFIFINSLSEERRYVFFTILEKYYLAVESIAFPLPQGFTSFFTFLGYKTLSFDMFMQYVNRNVFELQVDVMKIILADTDNTKLGIQAKLKMLAALPRSRAKRLLNQWNHPLSLMLRAREHSLNILSGVAGPPSSRIHGIQKGKGYRGITAFPSSDHRSPLDTFLDLLTAKATLTDIDFGLLIEATEASMEDFL